MVFVFIDEAGYTPNWASGIPQQPFYALSAVCIHADQLRAAYGDVRQRVAAIGLASYPAPLGQGFEVKAREVASGGGWWQAHNNERNTLRDIMLSAPRLHGGCAFVVAIDKKAHILKYAKPQDPYMLAFQFVLERLMHRLNDLNESAYIIYDQNTRLQAGVLAKAASLVTGGSKILTYNWYRQEYATLSMNMDRIIEVSIGESKHSLGLQLADYFATFTYSYFRDGKPNGCGWWQTLSDSLHQHQGTVNGVGLKVFP